MLVAALCHDIDHPGDPGGLARVGVAGAAFFCGVCGWRQHALFGCGYYLLSAGQNVLKNIYWVWVKHRDLCFDLEVYTGVPFGSWCLFLLLFQRKANQKPKPFWGSPQRQTQISWVWVKRCFGHPKWVLLLGVPLKGEKRTLKKIPPMFRRAHLCGGQSSSKIWTCLFAGDVPQNGLGFPLVCIKDHKGRPTPKQKRINTCRTSACFGGIDQHLRFGS